MMVPSSFRAPGVWSPDSIPDQSGRTAVITGGNGGIGLAVAQRLAERGADVVLACRDPERGARALRRVRDQVPGASIACLPLDLADLSSVRGFARTWGDRPVDLLVNNAGTALVPLSRTRDGFEAQFGINHLGHFALTGLLLPRLLETPAPRVIAVASESQRWGRFRLGGFGDFADVGAERSYRPLPAYVRSKRAVTLFAMELQRRSAAAGTALRAMVAIPGFTATTLLLDGQHRDRWLWRRMVSAVNRLAMTPEQGARTALYAATVQDLPGGSYVAPRGPLEVRGVPAVRGSHGADSDESTAGLLWQLSEELTGVRPEPAAASN